MVKGIGIQILSDFCNLQEALKFVKKEGIDTVELNLNNPYFSNSLLETQRVGGINLLMHFPEDTPIFSLSSRIFREYLDWIKSLKKVCRKMGVRVVTIHLGSAPSLAFSGEKFNRVSIFPEYFRKIAAERISKLDELAIDIPIAVENAAAFHYEITQELLLKTKNLKFTMDIGHLEALPADSKNKELSFFKKMQDRIINIHIHDNDKEWDSHLPVGGGKIEFESYKEFLKKLDTYVIVEVRPLKNALISYKRLKSILL